MTTAIKPLIFVIEDQKALALAYADALTLAGFRTQLMFDGQQALDALKDTTPDVMVLDMNLPGVSGHYVHQHVRSQEHLKHIPIIVATANSLLAAAIDNENHDTTHIVIKPVSLIELQKMVKDLCPVD